MQKLATLLILSAACAFALMILVIVELAISNRNVSALNRTLAPIARIIIENSQVDALHAMADPSPTP